MRVHGRGCAWKVDASCPHATLTLISTILSRRQLNSSPNPTPNAIQTQLFYALEQKELQLQEAMKGKKELEVEVVPILNMTQLRQVGKHLKVLTLFFQPHPYNPRLRRIVNGSSRRARVAGSLNSSRFIIIMICRMMTTRATLKCKPVDTTAPAPVPASAKQHT